MKSQLICSALACLFTLSFAQRSHADEASARSEESISGFLRDNCLDCHDGPSSEGGFELESLLTSHGFDLNHRASLHRWVRVFDRVRAGEMPPPDFGELDTEHKKSFLDATYSWIDGFQSKRQDRLGRVRGRRLTNRQLERTLCDLLAIDIPLARLIPEETRTDGFRNIADAQTMSHYHLDDHLRVVDAALDEALARVSGKDDRSIISMKPSRIADKPPGTRNRDPELRNGLAVVWNGGTSFYGRISNSEIESSGWYRIRLTASCVKPPESGTVWCSVRSGECVSRAPLMNWVGSFEATQEAEEFVYTAWLDEGHLLEVRPADATLRFARFKGGQIGYGEGEPQNVPGVAMHSLEFERVFPGGDVEQVSQRLFGDLDVRFDKASRRLKLESKRPRQDLRKQIRRFATRAFRVPVTNEMLEPFFLGCDQLLAKRVPPIDVLRSTYRAILCSPRFLYFNESPGRLSDHAVATRLSFLLTGSMPDRRLAKLAVEGSLSAPDQLIAQTRRLLDGDHFDAFVSDFTDQWLDLTNIAFTEPDRRLHKDFDLVVQNAMLEETRRFIKTLIEENRPARELVDAEFTWLNARLAAYYGIDVSIAPSEWKRISLVDHLYRGGLMTHGSILKVTADGTNTSPVVRGAWVCERLLGIPVPDPPENVPAIEPDIRGTTTIRDRLEKHRSIAECASCHATIDPPGFALEHFDAAGRWRDHYTVRKGRKNEKGPLVDAAYHLSDGQSFDSFQEFRGLASENEADIARNFAAQLLVYATGREITFADRKALDNIIATTEDSRYGLRSLIEAVVTSHPFLHK